MGYVVAAIIVLLLVAGFVTFLVLNSMRKGSAQAEDPTPGIGQDPTPLGDTTEHAGSHGESGATEEDPEDPDRGVDPSGAERTPGGEGPAQPGRPEDRQLRDAGARER